MSLPLCGIQTLYCALIRRQSLYRRFRASVTQAILAKQDHHSKLSLNYDKQFNKGGIIMSCKKGGTYELY